MKWLNIPCFSFFSSLFFCIFLYTDGKMLKSMQRILNGPLNLKIFILTYLHSGNREGEVASGSKRERRFGYQKIIQQLSQVGWKLRCSEWFCWEILKSFYFSIGNFDFSAISVGKENDHLLFYKDFIDSIGLQSTGRSMVVVSDEGYTLSILKSNSSTKVVNNKTKQISESRL
jgi:hypothetical protein